MKARHGTGTMVLTATMLLVLTACDRSNPDESAFDLGDYEGQLRAEADARAKDPGWTPSHTEIAVIRVDENSTGGSLQNFCVNGEGQLLLCWAGQPATEGGAGIRVLTPEGKPVATWALDFTPQAICVDAAGMTYVGGAGRLAKLGTDGKVLASATSPALAASELSDEELEAQLKEMGVPSDQKEIYRQALKNRRNDITGLGTTGSDVFVACASPKGFGYAAYRLDQDLKNSKLVIEKLSGCCGQMDITAHDGKLWVAHNGKHRVETFDRDGRQLASFGRMDRRAADGFGGCCEPKNLRIASNGDVLAAESGPPVAIKRFTAEGKFLGVIASPTFDSGCVRTTVDVSPDGKRFYLLDAGSDTIHVFAVKD